MMSNARKYPTLLPLLLLFGCAQLDFTASQEQAPIESRQPVVTESEDESGGVENEKKISTQERSNEVIAISPLDNDEVGAPEPIDGTSDATPGRKLVPQQSKSSDATQQLLADAQRSFVTGDLANAEAITNRGLRVAPQDPALWIQLAKIRLGQKSFGEAISLGERAQVLAENNLAAQIDALQVIATAERARGNATRASELEKQARELKGRLGSY